MNLSIIIVNFNVRYFLEQCLCSVVNAIGKLDAEIIVVDNNSTDGSRDFFDGRFPRVRFIWNNENIGFSKANNLGLKHAGGEYVLFLNPDTIIPEDSLEKCLQVFASQPEIGALGARMIDGTGCFLKESKRGFPSPFTSFFKLAGLADLFPKSSFFARYYLGQLPDNQHHEVDVLAGAFMIVRRNILERVQGFDERFFMYGEDVDLSYRIRKAGYKNLYFSGTTIIHFKGESTKKGNLNYVKLFYGAMSLFVQKHYSKGFSRAYKLAIRPAIWAKAVASWGWHGLIQNAPKAKAYVGAKLVVADQAGYYFIVSGSEGKKDNIHRVAPKQFENGTIGNLSQLDELVEKYKATEIIFCSNGLAVKDIIATIQQLGPRVNFSFHLAGSLSIVGSSSKDAVGEYVALEPVI